jgi:hypothetical protein
VDRLGELGFCVIPVNASGSPLKSADYPNRRSELWFVTANKAAAGLISFARLEQDIRSKLRTQAMAPTWKLDSAGRRVVEKKEETKEKLKRSPDDMDAVNLAYWDGGESWLPIQGQPKPTAASQAYLGLGSLERYDNSSAVRRGLYGR